MSAGNAWVSDSSKPRKTKVVSQGINRLFLACAFGLEWRVFPLVRLIITGGRNLQEGCFNMDMPYFLHFKIGQERSF